MCDQSPQERGCWGRLIHRATMPCPVQQACSANSTLQLGHRTHFPSAVHLDTGFTSTGAGDEASVFPVNMPGEQGGANNDNR